MQQSAKYPSAFLVHCFLQGRTVQKWAEASDKSIRYVTLVTDPLDAQIFNKFITILYMYMFRAISSSSSGGQVILTLNLLTPTKVGALINP